MHGCGQRGDGRRGSAPDRCQSQDPVLGDLYHVGGGEDLTAFFSRFSAADHIAFWESNGIRLHDRQGYVYPRTDQASTIAEAYEKIPFNQQGSLTYKKNMLVKFKYYEDTIYN